MRILQLIHKCQNRGAETFASQLSNNLMKNGHEVKMVAIYAGNAELPYKSMIEELNADPKIWFNFSAWRKLSQIIREFNPDLVQANSGDTLKYAVLSKVIFRWEPPLIFRNASEVGQYFKSTVHKQLNQFLYKKVQFVISVSHASKSNFLKHFPSFGERIVVIPIGIEQKEVEGIELQPFSQKHIIHVGGFTFEKNHPELIEIFEKIVSKFSCHLHLVGDGPLKPEIERLVNSKGLSDNITFYGFLDDPLPLVKSADVLLLPSIIEGLPGVILEAMYCDTPVIAYNVGGVSEILSRSTGWLVEKENQEEFISSVIEVLQGKDSERTKSAYELVLKKFTNEKITARFIEVYERFLKYPN